MKKITLIISVLVLPLIASAAFSQTKSYISSASQIVQSLTVMIMGLALLFFFWGLAKFILSSGDEKKLADGKRIMMWGVIALFFMSSIWGIVGFVGNEFGIRSGGIFDVGAPPTGSTQSGNEGINSNGGDVEDNGAYQRWDCGNWWQENQCY